MTNSDEFQHSKVDLSIRKVPFDYSWKWLHLSALFAKKNYPSAVAIGLIQLVLALIGRIPFLGEAIYSFISVLLGAGILLVVQKWFKGEKPEVSSVFFAFKNRDMLRSLTPLAIFSMLVTLVTSLGAQIVEMIPIFGIFYFAYVVIALPLSYMIMTYSAPLIVFQNKSTLEAMKTSLFAVYKNFWTELVGVILFGLLLVSCIIALVAPVVLVFMPIAVSVWYIKYLSVFENFDLQDCIDKSQKPKDNPIYIDKAPEGKPTSSDS